MILMTTELFNNAAKAVMKLNKSPTNDEMLELYGLFKQAKFGDNTSPEPSLLYYKAKAKWGAWEKNKGMKQDDAMITYIKLVSKMIDKYG